MTCVDYVTGKRKQLDPVTISTQLHKEAMVLGSKFRTVSNKLKVAPVSHTKLCS